jgi:hypothetical protein
MLFGWQFRQPAWGWPPPKPATPAGLVPPPTAPRVGGHVLIAFHHRALAQPVMLAGQASQPRCSEFIEPAKVITDRAR